MSQKAQQMSGHNECRLKPFECSLLLDLFPFGIMLNKGMQIIGGGEKLVEIWKNSDSFLNQPVTKYFKLRRPKGVAFTWKNVNMMSLS